MISWHARCDCMLWNALWFYCVFWVFSYTIYDHLCLNCCISTKLSLGIQFMHTNISNMPDVTASYGIPLDIVTIFANFAQNWRILISEVFYHTHILLCLYARCNYKLWKVLWFDWFFEKFYVWYVIFSSNFSVVANDRYV